MMLINFHNFTGVHLSPLPLSADTGINARTLVLFQK